jgi:hypothetical protein
MQMIVNKEMANRMDDSNSITACPRGELRSDSGLDATVVMGYTKMKQTRKWRAVPATNDQGRKTGLGTCHISRSLIVPQGFAFRLNSP